MTFSGTPPIKPNIVPLKAKLGVVAVILLFEAVLFGGCWLAAALSGSDRDAPDLPPLASLTETPGTVVGFAVNQVRTRRYHAPIVAFSANGASHQISTRAGYNLESIPFKAGDTVPVLYDQASPEAAWVKWEYDRTLQEAATPRFADIARTWLTRLALGLIALTVVALLVYLLAPIKAD